MRKQQVGVTTEAAAVVLLTRHHQEVGIRMPPRPFDGVVADLQFVAAPAAAAPAGIATGTSASSSGRKIGGNRTAAWVHRAWRRTLRTSAHRIILPDDVDAERLQRAEGGRGG